MNRSRRLSSPALTEWKEGSRLLFMALTNTATQEALSQWLERENFRSVLDKDMFATDCWHQSLSSRYADTPGAVETLLETGESIRAKAFILTLDRLAGTKEAGWKFFSKFPHPELAALTGAIRQELLAKRAPVGEEHTAHVSISYWASTARPSTRMPPVHWTINELLLVRGDGKPYRYQVLGSWPLYGTPEPPSEQLQLL